MHTPLRLLRRAALLALVGALGGAALSGCDSDGGSAAATGPVVQFATTGATATEGSSLRIPVVLTNGSAASGPVSVDVLFAAGASTARDTVVQTATGPDSTDFFGLPASVNGFRVVRLTFAAGAEVDTQYVEITAVDDGRVEAAEDATFALQNAQNATIGPRREFSATIGVLPISVIRLRADGEAATVEGIVTRARGRTAMIQDETGGITIFSPSGSDFFNAIASGEISEGDRIQVEGEVDIFNQLVEVAFVTDFAVVQADAGLPAPQTVTLAQLAANVPAYESELVRVENITFQTSDVVFGAGVNYNVVDAAGTVFVLRVPSASDTDAFGTPIPVGPTTFTGVLGNFRGTGQLTLVHRSDLTP